MPLNAAQAPNLAKAPTSSDIIHKFIRDAIADGSLNEGEPIRQDEVARMFSVSKIPVREALKRLEAEGLVEFQRNKGAIVTPVSEPEIAQIFEMRAIMESSLIRLSIPHMTEQTFRKAISYCDDFARETNVARWAELNWRFHSCLYEDAGRPVFVAQIRAVNDRLERYLRVQLTLSRGQETADREHRLLVELCRNREVEEASRLLYDHIMNACASLLESLPRGGLSARA